MREWQTFQNLHVQSVVQTYNICQNIRDNYGRHVKQAAFEANKALLTLHWEHSGSVVECLIETEGPRVRASPAYIYPCLVLVQPRKTRPNITEKLLTGI